MKASHAETASSHCQSLIPSVSRIGGPWSRDTTTELTRAVKVLACLNTWISSTPLQELRVPIGSFSTACQVLQTFLDSHDLSRKNPSTMKCMGISLEGYRHLLACYTDMIAVYFSCAYGEGMPMDQFRKDPIDKVLASVIWDLDYAKGIVRAASETDGSKKQLNNGLNALHMLHEKVRAQIQDWHWAGDLAPRVYVAVRAHEHLRSALQRNSIEAEFLKPIQDFGENIAKMDSIVLSTKDPSNILDLSVILEALYQKCWQLTKDIQQHQCGDGELQNMLANSTKVREAIQLQEVLLIATGILKTRGTLTR